MLKTLGKSFGLGRFLSMSNVCMSDLCMTSHPELWGTWGCWEELGYPEHAAWEGKVSATKLNLSSLGKSLEDSGVEGWEAGKRESWFHSCELQGDSEIPRTSPLHKLFKVLPLHSHRHPGYPGSGHPLKALVSPVSTRAQARRGTPSATGCS